MIPDIKEIDFPKKDGKQYATLTQATVSLSDMGERTISTQIKIDGDIVPDFSSDWEVEFGGERYIMPLRKPQGAKENTSLNSTIDLTFVHWAVYQLKRWYFFTVQPTESGTAVADKYIASVSLDLREFCNMMGQVLDYYFNGAIVLQLNDTPGQEYGTEAVNIDISYSYLWDVLIKLYEMYAVRWHIEAEGCSEEFPHGRYIIKVGYNAPEINHIFEYGFKGGLLKVERQVQDDSIRNTLLGRGGDRNLPYRYFKDVDPNNPSWPADPDWIPELRNIYFTELRGKAFRDYVKGWKTNPNRQLKEADGTPIKPYGSNTPIAVEPFSSDYARSSFAYMRGHSDEKFDPVEYVADKYYVSKGVIGVVKGSSIDKYGVLPGALDNNEDIYPTLQGVVVEPYGRVDEAVCVEQIESDAVEEATEAESTKLDIKAPSVLVETLRPLSRRKYVSPTCYLPRSVPQGYTGSIDLTLVVAWINAASQKGSTEDIEISNVTVRAYKSDGTEVSPVGLAAGSYTFTYEFEAYNKNKVSTITATIDLDIAKLILSPEKERWAGTWNVWIKNVWNSARRAGESDTAYAERVWRPILGDRTGNEARLVFSDGWLSISEDYEFTIVKLPEFDAGKTIDGVPSHWRLTLAKSDAELEASGLYVPNTRLNGNDGDHFFFVGIDMPHDYVLWAEERLDAYKADELEKVKDVKPTWVVSLDKVRMANMQPGESVELINLLSPGASVTLADRRFIGGSTGEKLYIQSLTYTYREPSSTDAALIPDVEVVLSDKYEVSATAVATLQGSVEALQRQIGAIGSMQQVIRAVCDRIYLRKDGFTERSMSPTEFASLLTSTNFRAGMIGGRGWGFYRDANGRWVLEIDHIKLRQDLEVNTLTVNQVVARGGMIVESAAQMEITRVEETDAVYRCYYDNKGGMVSSLFVAGDVAYCTRYSADYERLKYYRRRVVAVGRDYVDMAKAGDVHGVGVPEEGDAVVQWGSYTEPRRRFVKVRDVVGGGYERYLSGLDSVTADGTEYYFVGRQEGQYGDKPRFFIGDGDNFMEYREGKLRYRGALELESTYKGKQLDAYMSEEAEGAAKDAVNAMEIGGTNLLLSSDFLDGLDNWHYVRKPTSGFVDINEAFGYNGNKSVEFDLHDNENFEYISIGQEVAALVNGELSGMKEGGEYTMSVNVYVPSSAAFDSWCGLIARCFDRVGTGWTDSIIECQGVVPGQWNRVEQTFRVASDTRSVWIYFQVARNGHIFVNSPKLEEGNKATAWSASPKDVSYLRTALQNRTSIQGGLVLATLLKLGYEAADGEYRVMAGINGDASRGTRSLAVWAGGDAIDAEGAATDETPARFVIRHDGTAYACGNEVRFDADHIEVGESTVLDRDGLKLFSDTGHTKCVLQVINNTVGDDFPGEGAVRIIKTSEPISAGAITLARQVASGGIVSSSYFISSVSGYAQNSIGVFEEGETLRLSATIGFVSPIAGTPGVATQINGTAFFKVYKSDNSLKPVASITKALKYESGNSWQAAFAVNVVIPSKGTYYVQSGIKPAMTSGGIETVGQASSYLEYNGTATLGIASQSILGNDGLVSVWGETALLVRKEMVGMMRGLTGVRISHLGIELTTNGSDGWRRLDVEKLPFIS